MAKDVKNEKLVPWWGWVLIIVGVPLVAALFGWIIYWGPSWLTQQGKASADAYLKAITDNRTALVQAVGGFAVFLGVIAGALTLRHNRQQLRQSREDHDRDLAAGRKEHEESLQANRDALEATLKVNRENLLLTERGQITDRFSKAIEQLGAAGPDSVDLRLGGIYALEQIARDSPGWHRPVMEVLAAFVRQHITGLPLTAGNTVDLQMASLNQVGLDQRWTSLKVDIDAAVAVLGRRDRGKDENRRINLHSANCNRVEFPVAVKFAFTDFSYAHMQFCRLFAADLQDAFFLATELQGADLERADLRRADLYGARLQKADLKDANLDDADLTSVDLSGVQNLTVDQLKVANTGADTTLPPYINAAELAAAKAAGQAIQPPG